MMNMRDYLVSLVRTAVPVAVGLVLAALAKAGVDVDEGSLSTVVDGVFVGGYYAAVRYVESKFPQAGVLLGWKARPAYEDAREGDH